MCRGCRGIGEWQRVYGDQGPAGGVGAAGGVGVSGALG